MPPIVQNDVEDLVATVLDKRELESLVSSLIQDQRPNVTESEMKQLLEGSGVIDKLAEKLYSSMQSSDEKSTGDKYSAKDLVEISNPRGTVEIAAAAQQLRPHTSKFVFGRQYLSVKVGKGKAFLGLPELAEDIGSSLTVHLHWRDSRLQSSFAMCSTEPSFHENWMMELPTKDMQSLLEIRDPLHFVVVRSDNHGTNTLVGTRSVEWRLVLQSPLVSKTIDIRDPLNSQLTVGLLDIEMGLVPKIFPVQHQQPTHTTNQFLLVPEEVEFQLKKELRAIQEYDRMFFTYAKRWWNDYLQMRPNLHSDRLVKIFATTEGGCGLVDGGDNHWVNEGGNNSSTSDSALGGRKEPVTSFVRPLRCPFLESPKHAARFVSLIPVERAQNIGASNKMEVWQETHTLLIMGKGDVHDHAVLLCSLLLGFCLDAYVTCGLDKGNNAHVWVTTIDPNESITLWDPISGSRYKRPLYAELGLKKKGSDNNSNNNKSNTANSNSNTKTNVSSHSFRTVGCCFNDKSFYANCQVSDAVDYTDFDFSKPDDWKPISRDAIASIKRSPIYPNFPFQQPPLEGDKTLLQHPSLINHQHHPTTTITNNAEEVVLALRQRIVAYREDHGLVSTVWDEENMEFLLDQVLWEYETGKVWHGGGNKMKGLSIEGARSPSDTDFFQAGIKNLIPEGHTFKGYPCCFTHGDVNRIFSSLIKATSCRDIFMSRGDKVRFSLSVKKFPYCEGVAACWVMIAVRYRQV